MKVTRLLYTPEEAAQALGVGRTLIYDLLPEIGSIKVGKLRRIPVENLEAYIARKKAEAA